MPAATPPDPEPQPAPEERQINAPAAPVDVRLPHLPPPHFTGRRRDLAKLLSALKANRALWAAEPGEPLRIAVTGWDGLGKTSLALQFCTSYQRFFKNIHWLRASRDPQQPESVHQARACLRAQIAACGASLGRTELDLDELVEATFQAWRDEKTPLIVFDDVEHPSQLEPFLPELPPRARVLITTRWQSWPADLHVHTLPLDGLPRPDSVLLLQRIADHLNTAGAAADLNTLAGRLNDLPLALDLAGRLLKLDTRLTPYQLNAALAPVKAGQQAATANLPPGAADYSPLLEPLVRQSWKGLHWLDHRDGVARAVMSLAACCAPGAPIPENILANTLHQARRSARPSLAVAWLWEWATRARHQEELPNILERLDALGLLKMTAGRTASVHPLVARLAQRFIGAASSPSLAGQPLEGLARTLVETGQNLPVGTPANNEISLSYRPHLLHTSALAGQAGLPQTGELWYHLGSHYHAFGENDLARACLLRAIQHAEEELGGQHLDLVKLYARLAEILHAAHDWTGERRAYERCLAIVEKNHGFYHLETAAHAAQLGRALLEASDAEEQQAVHLERALLAGGISGNSLQTAAPALSESLDLPSSLPEIQARSAQLAIARLSASDIKGREAAASLLSELYQASVEAGKEVVLRQVLLAPHTAESATLAAQFAQELLSMGQTEARRAARTLGALLETRDPNARQAVALLTDLLALREASEQPAAPERAELERANLKRTWQELRDAAAARRTARLGLALAARPYLERALRIYDHQPDADPLGRCAATYHLGLVLQSSGELPAARHALETSLRLAEEHYGEAHEKTALRLISLGAVLLSLGDLPRARQVTSRGVDALSGLPEPGGARLEAAQAQLAAIHSALG